MIRVNFKSDYIIKRRDNPPKKNDYHQYLPELNEDFRGRCGYCNAPDDLVEIEIDHFVPKSIAPHLEREYSNLVYSCKQCNRAKSSKCSPIKDNNYVNSYFYDPAIIDYNSKFYRNEYGYIFSDDALGREMINRLKLYRATYSMIWIIDTVRTFTKNIDALLESTNNHNVEIYRYLHKIDKIKDDIRSFLQRSFNGLINIPNKKGR